MCIINERGSYTSIEVIHFIVVALARIVVVILIFITGINIVGVLILLRGNKGEGLRWVLDVRVLV